jgi:dihydrodipicolinate synthase/N-acetylneuraminate lyase
MEAQRPPQGLIVDLVTPLNRDGSIDDVGLGRHLEGLMPSAKGFLFASPVTGEGLNLALDQRRELLERVLQFIRGRVPVLVWITDDDDEQTKKNLKSLDQTVRRANYTGPVYWVDTPLYYHSNRGLPEHYEELNSISEHPFLLFNDPNLISKLGKTLKRKNIRTEILKKLCLSESIAGMIFMGSLERARNYRKASRNIPNFRIYDGDENQFLNHPSLSGVTSKGANLTPAGWHRITASSLGQTNSGKTYPDSLQQIWELGRHLRELKDLYDKNPAAIIKLVLSEIDIIETPFCTMDFENGDETVRQAKELVFHLENATQ